MEQLETGLPASEAAREILPEPEQDRAGAAQEAPAQPENLPAEQPPVPAAKQTPPAEDPAGEIPFWELPFLAPPLREAARQPPAEQPGTALPEEPLPDIRQLQARLDAVTRQLQQQEARHRLEQQMEAIRRLDPELGSLDALARQPEFGEFDRLVQGGQDLVSAYKLAFFDRYARRSAQAARQAAINAARAKGHLASVGTGPLPAEDGLTDELIRSYRLYNPGMSRQQIARYHARYRKEKQHV